MQNESTRSRIVFRLLLARSHFWTRGLNFVLALFSILNRVRGKQNAGSGRKILRLYVRAAQISATILLLSVLRINNFRTYPLRYSVISPRLKRHLVLVMSVCLSELWIKIKSESKSKYVCLSTCLFVPVITKQALRLQLMRIQNVKQGMSLSLGF